MDQGLGTTPEGNISSILEGWCSLLGCNVLFFHNLRTKILIVYKISIEKVSFEMKFLWIGYLPSMHRYIHMYLAHCEEKFCSCFRIPKSHNTQSVKVTQNTQMSCTYTMYIYCWHIYYTLVNEDKYIVINEHVCISQCVYFILCTLLMVYTIVIWDIFYVYMYMCDCTIHIYDG